MKAFLQAIALAALCSVTAGCVMHHGDDESVTRMFGSDYFGAGGMLNLTEPVAGDAFLAAGQVSTAGEVRGDLVAAGGEISIGGNVGDDLYAAGGEVQVDAIVMGNARVAGGEIMVGPATAVTGGLSLTGGRIVFQGDTQEYLQASGASVHINGSVHGDAEVRAEDIEIGPETRIDGKLVVRGPTEPVIPDGAQIVGGVEYHETDAGRWFHDAEIDNDVRSAAHGVGSFLWVVGVFVVGTLFTLALPGYSARAADFIGREPLRAMGLGFVVLVCVPVLIVVLLITIIGIPLALILLPVYVALLFLGWITAALFLGRKGLSLARPAAPPSERWPQAFAFLLAVVTLWLLGQVPVVGGWVKFIALLLGMGALVWQLGSARRATAPAVT
jgi:hypothetical protein